MVEQFFPARVSILVGAMCTLKSAEQAQITTFSDCAHVSVRESQKS